MDNYLAAGPSLWRAGTTVRGPRVARGRFRMELMGVRGRPARRVVTVRVQAVGGVVLRVLQPRDHPLVLLAEVASHQRRFTDNHHVLESRKGALRFGFCFFFFERNVQVSMLERMLTCDAREKLGPGDLFLLGAGGALLPGPDVLPFRFLRLLAGLWDSGRNESEK